MASNPSNYRPWRPISLTCTCCKILESIISAELISFLDNHNLITKHQHGFLKRHFTCSNRLESFNDWAISLSNKKSVVIANIDFTRAFDSISHSKHIIKLVSYGIRGNLLDWITMFLSDQTQCVRVGTCLSSYRHVISGVPQGSVLGPLLFNVYINDITDSFSDDITAKLFANDIKLYTQVTTSISLQNFRIHFDHIHAWSILWQLSISSSKCSSLESGKRYLATHFIFLLNLKFTTNQRVIWA